MELHPLAFVLVASVLSLPIMICSAREKWPDEVAQEYGYYTERHTVVTSHGYILPLYRVLSEKPRGNGPVNKPVVLLVPTLLINSISWVLFGRERAPGLAMADAGFDVWMSDTRGTSHAKKHVKYKDNTRQFWNFTHDEMGRYDLPDHVDFALQATGQSTLQIVGYSLGTTVILVMLAERPEYNSKVSHVYLWSPSAYYGFVSPVVHALSFTAPLLDRLAQEVFHGETPVPRTLVEQTCTNRSTKRICIEMIALTSGPFYKRFNESDLPVFIKYGPESTPSKIFLHYQQGVGKERWFRRFDYNERNMIAYGRPTPPPFNLRAITAPVSIYYGSGDQIILSKNVEQLAEDLPNVARLVVISDNFTHIDFFTAIDLREKLVTPMLSHMREDFSSARFKRNKNV